MKRTSIILAALLFLNSLVFAQLSSLEKIDEFGRVNSEVLEARIHAITETARNQPDKIIKIAIFRSPNISIGFTHRFGARILAYAKHREIEDGKFTFEDCGIGETRRTTFYLISKESNETVCTNNEKTDFTKSFLYDTFWESDGCYSCCIVDCFDKETREGSIYGLSKLLKKYPESKAYIFINWKNSSFKKTKAQTKYVKEVKKVFDENGIADSRYFIQNRR